MSYYTHYKPDGYAFIKIQAYGAKFPVIKVFASWSGGYMNGDSWRLNSGCLLIEEDDPTAYIITGYSGRQYLLSKTHNFISTYNLGVMNDMIAELRSYGHQAEIISVEDAITLIREN